MDKEYLYREYVSNKKSAAEIALDVNYTVSKVNYWLKKFNIEKRSISESIYIKNNIKGDPFTLPQNISNYDDFLFGLGIGLFWGEGNKRNKYSVRLGNTDPSLIKMFIKFLIHTYKIDATKLRFGLQIFNDIDPNVALQFWSKELGFSLDYFYPSIVVSQIRGKGSYGRKSEHGVLTVYFNNMKLKTSISKVIENI